MNAPTLIDSWCCVCCVPEACIIELVVVGLVLIKQSLQYGACGRVVDLGTQIKVQSSE